MTAEHNPPPRIPVRNAWHMLLYAWELQRWKNSWKGAVENSPNLLGLLATILVESTRRLFLRNLGREHLRTTETIRGIRGRIDFARSLKRLEFENGRATCSFSELDVDTPRNRIIRGTLERLAREPRLHAGDEREASQLRSRLRATAKEMDGVSLIRPSTFDFSRLQKGRNDEAYRLPLAICSLVFGLRLPTQQAGDVALAALLRDEIVFHKVFENFVRNFYRYHLPGHSVARETLKWHDELANKLVPIMETDITLVEKRPPHRRMIVDTKYSQTTLQEGPYGSQKFKSTNLYQLYAYLRTQEHLDEPHRTAEGMLLYPTTQRELTEELKLQGHRVRVATVDLAMDWPAIEARLLSLATS